MTSFDPTRSTHHPRKTREANVAHVRCITTVHLPDNVTIGEGSILNDDDPVVKRYGHFFEPLDATARRDLSLIHI